MAKASFDDLVDSRATGPTLILVCRFSWYDCWIASVIRQLVRLLQHIRRSAPYLPRFSRILVILTTGSAVAIPLSDTLLGTRINAGD